MKKLPVMITTLSMTAAGLLSGVAQAADVSIETGDVQITSVNVRANTVTMLSNNIPAGKSTTWFELSGLGADRERETQADAKMAERTTIVDEPGMMQFYQGRLYDKGAQSGVPVVFDASDFGGLELKNNTSYVLYGLGENFGTVKADYRRCVESAAYQEKAAGMWDWDTLECRLETDDSSGAKWYQPYFNGVRLEIAEPELEPTPEPEPETPPEVPEVPKTPSVPGTQEEVGGLTGVEGDSGVLNAQGGQEVVISDGAAWLKAGDETVGELTPEAVAVLRESTGQGASGQIVTPVLGGEEESGVLSEDEMNWWWLILVGLGVAGVVTFLAVRHKRDSVL